MYKNRATFFFLFFLNVSVLLINLLLVGMGSVFNSIYECFSFIFCLPFYVELQLLNLKCNLFIFYLHIYTSVLDLVLK